MDRLRSDASRARFDAYIEALVSVIGHADRVGPLRDYCTGLYSAGRALVTSTIINRLRHCMAGLWNNPVTGANFVTAALSTPCHETRSWWAASRLVLPPCPAAPRPGRSCPPSAARTG